MVATFTSAVETDMALEQTKLNMSDQDYNLPHTITTCIALEKVLLDLSRSDLLMFVFITVTGLLLVVAVECHYIILEYLSGSLNRIVVASFGLNHFINRDVY